MGFFTKKSTVQKIILALVVIILFNFAIPIKSQAKDDWETIGGKILKELVKLIDSLGDVVMGMLNKAMLGTEAIYSSVMLDPDDAITRNSIKEKDGIFYSDGTEQPREPISSSDYSTGLLGSFKLPNMLYCPENIFANKIPAFDVNFIHPNSYKGVYGDAEESFANKLAPTIASWYKAFRNIAVVGLLCVLVYLGIRTLIETSAQGKARYKESLKNWFVALCLVFAIHFIMAGTLMFIDYVTELLTSSLGTSNIYLDISGVGPVKTNLTGYVRLQAEHKEWGNATAYSLIYIVLVIYTVMFTFTYFKRFLWMAFLTMIAPLVSLTYPIDKVGDGKAQAFNMWFKEYIMNAILQPVHLLLYSVMVSSAIDLAKDNPIYALVAIGFLIPAEKFIKKMFGLDKGETPGGLGSFAGGAMTMKALESLGRKAPSPLDKGGKGKNPEPTNENKIRQNRRSTLEGWRESGNIDIDGSDIAKGTALAGGAAAKKITEDDSVNYPSKSMDAKDVKNLNDKLEDNKLYQKQLTQNEKDNNKKTSSSNNGIKASRKRAIARMAKKGAIKGVKSMPKAARFLAKKGLRGSGLVMGGAIGLAAGIASGDPSQALKYSIAGAAAGNRIGDGIYNLSARSGSAIINGTKSGTDALKSAYRDERYTLAEKRNREIEEQNRAAKKAFMKNEEEKARYEDLTARLQESGVDCTLDQVMNTAFDYKVAGLDEDKIETGLKLESKYGNIGGNNHEQIMDIMDLTNKYGPEYILKAENRAAMEGSIRSIAGSNSDQVMQLFAEAHGLEEYYKEIQTKENAQKTKAKSNIITGPIAAEKRV